MVLFKVNNSTDRVDMGYKMHYMMMVLITIALENEIGDDGRFHLNIGTSESVVIGDLTVVIIVSGCYVFGC